MSKSLVIVESPAKARTISKYLGTGFKVVATMGHIIDLPEDELGIDIERNFKPQYVTIKGKKAVIDNIKKEARNADNVYLATDPDREGEAISWHLARVLNLPANLPCRIEFHEVTKDAVLASLRTPRQIDMNLVNAQQARRILDRLVGYMISPILWEKVKGAKSSLSAGRVQSAALKLICDRENEIRDFTPEEYWTVEAELLDGNTQMSFRAKLHSKNGNKVSIRNKEEADEIINELQDKDFVVVEVKKGGKRRNPPEPFTTSTLQQEAARKLGFTAKKTMQIAQQLYEGLDIKGEGTVGLITYMRTDSARVSEQAKEEAARYIKDKYGEEYTSNLTVRQKQNKNIQDAHEAIRPTSVYRTPDKVKDSLTFDQYRLYKLIWERFVASRMAPAIYDTITVDIKAGDYIFRAAGSNVKFKGFETIYVEGHDDEKEKEEIVLPDLVKGQKLVPSKIIPQQHFTQPPPRYTEATLVKTLEEKGIGRPSTYARIIDTILQRGYVEKEKGKFKPTRLGEVVTELLKKHFADIVDIRFTAEMEERLDRIETGKENWHKVVADFYHPFEEKIKLAKTEISKVEAKGYEETDEICEVCGKKMVIKKGKYGKFLSCSGYPECKNAKPLKQDTGIKCPKCGGKLIKKKTKKGKIFYGCENYPNCNYATWQLPT